MSYHRVFCMSPDGLWHFPAEEARRAAYEDLGADFFGFDGCYDFVYDSASDEYVFGLEFGAKVSIPAEAFPLPPRTAAIL